MKLQPIYVLLLFIFLTFPHSLLAQENKTPFTINGKTVPRILASVNGVPITSDVLQRDFFAFRFQSKQMGKEIKPNEEHRIALELLESAVARELVVQKAKSLGILITEKKIDLQVKSIEDEQVVSDVLKTVEPEDLIQYGLIPEFVGRLPVVATLNELDESALVQILTEPKNSLTKQYHRMFEMEGVEIEFREDALSAIAAKAMERKTGARGLRSIIENVLLDTMFDLPSAENVAKVVVDENVISGENAPILIYQESETSEAS